MAYRPDRGWGFGERGDPAGLGDAEARLPARGALGPTRAGGNAARDRLMELLLILTYAAICYAIFKIFKVPVNKWTIPTAVLGGVILIAIILLVMNYNHPYTKRGAALLLHHADRAGGARRGDRGPGQGQRPPEAGRRTIPDRPAPLRVCRRAEARRARRGRAGGAASSRRRWTRRRPTSTWPWPRRDRAQQAFERYEAGEQPAVGVRVLGARGREPPRRSISGLRRRWRAPRRRAEQARIAYEAEIDGVNTDGGAPAGRAAAGRVRSRRDDGQGPDRRLRDPTVPAPRHDCRAFSAAAGDGVHPQRGQRFAAAFQQNALQRVRAGDEAEIAFDASRAASSRARSGASWRPWPRASSSPPAPS